MASGLALATTLMAMQVADTMTARSACSYRQEVTPVVRSDGGYLGIRFHFERTGAHVERVFPGTPAEAIGMRAGDIVLAVDGNRIDSSDELSDLIYNAKPGSRPTILIQRGDQHETKQPTLISWPAVTY